MGSYDLFRASDGFIVEHWDSRREGAGLEHEPAWFFLEARSFGWARRIAPLATGDARILRPHIFFYWRFSIGGVLPRSRNSGVVQSGFVVSNANRRAKKGSRSSHAEPAVATQEGACRA